MNCKHDVYSEKVKKKTMDNKNSMHEDRIRCLLWGQWIIMTKVYKYLG